MTRGKSALAAIVARAALAGALAQSDFERYGEEIRKCGMSEGAAGSLQHPASLLSGAVVFTVERAPDGGA